MSKKAKAVKPEVTDKSTKATPAAKTVQRKPAPKPKGTASDFDCIGRVTRIHVKSGPAGPEFEFALHGRKGARQSFRISAAHDSAMLAMAQIVIAAHDRDAKIGVRSEKGGDGLAVATEIAWRPKPSKDS
jgi:hypothetical protein